MAIQYSKKILTGHAPNIYDIFFTLDSLAYQAGAYDKRPICLMFTLIKKAAMPPFLLRFAALTF
jgi:hypothetical protein